MPQQNYLLLANSQMLTNQLVSTGSYTLILSVLQRSCEIAVQRLRSANEKYTLVLAKSVNEL